MPEDNCPVVKVDFEEATRLAELGAVAQDLGAVMETCRRIEGLSNENSNDHILIEGLWTAALVRYARCFTEAKRQELTESIFDGFHGQPIAAHRYYIDMRNKHIAHSVNPFEQTYAGVVLTPETSKVKSVVGVTTLAMRHIVCDLNGVHQLGVLAKIVLGKVCEKAKDCEKKLLARIKALPIEDLYRIERLQVRAPGPETAGKARP